MLQREYGIEQNMAVEPSDGLAPQSVHPSGWMPAVASTPWLAEDRCLASKPMRPPLVLAHPSDVSARTASGTADIGIWDSEGDVAKGPAPSPYIEAVSANPLRSVCTPCRPHQIGHW